MIWDTLHIVSYLFQVICEQVPGSAFLARADHDAIFVSLSADHILADSVATVTLELQIQLSPLAAFRSRVSGRCWLRFLLVRLPLVSPKGNGSLDNTAVRGFQTSKSERTTNCTVWRRVEFNAEEAQGAHERTPIVNLLLLLHWRAVVALVEASTEHTFFLLDDFTEVLGWPNPLVGFSSPLKAPLVMRHSTREPVVRIVLKSLTGCDTIAPRNVALALPNDGMREKGKNALDLDQLRTVLRIILVRRCTPWLVRHSWSPRGGTQISPRLPFFLASNFQIYGPLQPWRSLCPSDAAMHTLIGKLISTSRPLALADIKTLGRGISKRVVDALMQQHVFTVRPRVLLFSPAAIKLSTRA